MITKRGEIQTMSEMKTQCPICRESFEVSADLGGQAYQCPECSANLILPLLKFATPQKKPSWIFRVATGLLGLPFVAFAIFLIAKGEPIGWELIITLLMGIVFLMYFFGGPRLLEKVGLGFQVQPTSSVFNTSIDDVTPSVLPGGGAVAELATGYDVNEHVAAFQRQLAAKTPRAFLTPAIVVINLIVFAIMIATGVHIMSPKIVDLLAWGANYAPKTTGGEWWRLVTSNYLHIGIIHIAFNMWVLWNAGRFVERLLGNFGFFLVYTFSGVAGGFATVLWNPEVVSAGASGAIFGVYGCLLAFLASDRSSIPRPLLKAIGNNAAFFVFINVLFGLGNKNVDMAAHLGGLAAGFISGFFLRTPLDSNARGNRKMRNLLLGAVGALAVSIGVMLTANRYVDIQSELRRFGETEVTVVETFTDTFREIRDGSISDDAFATILKEDVIAPWEAAMSEFESDTQGKLPKLSKRNSELHGNLVNYMHLRLDAFKLLLESVEENDQQKAQLANAKLLEAQAILDSIQNGGN